jgi:hypothetical protein
LSAAPKKCSANYSKTNQTTQHLRCKQGGYFFEICVFLNIALVWCNIGLKVTPFSAKYLNKNIWLIAFLKKNTITHIKWSNRLKKSWNNIQNGAD